MTKASMFKVGALVRFHHNGRWKVGRVTFKPRNRSFNYEIIPTDTGADNPKAISYPATHPSIHDANGPKLVCIGGGYEVEKGQVTKKAVRKVRGNIQASFADIGSAPQVEQQASRSFRRGQKPVVVEHHETITGRTTHPDPNVVEVYKTLKRSPRRNRSVGKISSIGDEITFPVKDVNGSHKFDVQIEKHQDDAYNLGRAFVAACKKASIEEVKFAHDDREFLRFADFSGMTTRHATIHGATLHDVRMNDAVLNNMRFVFSDLSSVQAERARFNDGAFVHSNCAYMNFSNADLDAEFHNSSIEGTNFNEARIRGKFIKSIGDGPSFHDAVIRDVYDIDGGVNDVKIRKMVASAVRFNSTYQFYLFEPVEPGTPDQYVIMAGCQKRTIRSYSEYLRHSVIGDDHRKAYETRNILDYFENIIAMHADRRDSVLIENDLQDHETKRAALYAPKTETVEEAAPETPKSKVFGVESFS